MRLYLNYFLMQLKSQMQFRISFLLATFGQFLSAFTSFLGIYFIFYKITDVDGFSCQEVFLCFAVVMMAF